MHSAVPLHVRYLATLLVWLSWTISYSLANDDPINFADCSPACDSHTEFCGVDLQCHLLSCDNIFYYAPEAYTGNDPNSEDDDDDLECEIAPSEDVLACENAFQFGDTVTPWPVAVSFKLLPNNDTTSLEEPDGFACSGFTADGLYGDVVLPFDRRCETDTFECYDFRRTRTDRLTAVQNFTSRVISMIEADPSAFQVTVYHTRLQPSTLVALDVHLDGRNLIQRDFNEDLAERQFQSRRIIKDTEDTSTAVPTPTPTPPPSSAPFSFSLVAVFFTVLAAIDY